MAPRGSPLSVAATLAAAVAAGLLTEGRAAADPLFLGWSALLPSLVDSYDPNSANECVRGGAHCVDATIEEMQRRFAPMATSCDHESVFALAYLRTTQTYEWARNQPGFFHDTAFVNHEDAVFAKYYFGARDAYAEGKLAVVPPAWQIAFRAADSKQVSGQGDLLLGMSAHVNRDLPMVLAAIGLAYPDGTSRKADHDKVNVFLNAVVEPLLDEEGARFDPSIPLMTTPYGIGYTGFFQLLEVWREAAWRNAELLVAAPNAAARALVVQSIEDQAAAIAQSLVLSNAYLPPFTTTASRDAYCAQHHDAGAPIPYAFGMP